MSDGKVHDDVELTDKAENKRRGWPKGKPRKVNGVIHTKKEEAVIDNGIRPTEFKVLIRQDTMKDKTEGGVWLPEPAIDDQQRAMMKGVIISMSPAAFSYHLWNEGARLPQVGDRVVYARYSGSDIVGKDKIKYRLINDKDIGAVIDF
jgi:chaperonin GroES